MSFPQQDFEVGTIKTYPLQMRYLGPESLNNLHKVTWPINVTEGLEPNLFQSRSCEYNQ